jgi:hypothetical protein
VALLLRKCAVSLALLLSAVSAHAAEGDKSWDPIALDEQQVRWAADELAATPHMAEVFTAPLGYRLERYFWRAQKPAGAFAIVVLRDLTGDDHYLSGPVDLMKFATTVLKGLEAPTPKALDKADHAEATPNGLASALRFELGARQCLVIGFYAAPNGKPPAKSIMLTEGSIRVDGVYCATAGEKMTSARASAVAQGLTLGREAATPAPETKK